MFVNSKSPINPWIRLIIWHWSYVIYKQGSVISESQWHVYLFFFLVQALSFFLLVYLFIEKKKKEREVGEDWEVERKRESKKEYLLSADSHQKCLQLPRLDQSEAQRQVLIFRDKMLDQKHSSQNWKPGTPIRDLNVPSLQTAVAVSNSSPKLHCVWKTHTIICKMWSINS